MSNTISNASANKSLLKKLMGFREITLIFIIIVISVIISILSPNFLTAENLITTALGLAADGILAIGMTIVLVSGGVDLSVGSVLGLSAVIAGGLYLSYGVNIWIGSLIALVICALIGLFNGYFIARIGIPPLIVTLAMMGIARGAAYVLTQGSPLSLYGNLKGFDFLGQGKIAGIPFFIVFFVILIILFDFLMRKSAPMRLVYYVGSNENAAKLSGINVPKVKISVYVLMSVLAGIAGIFTLSRFSVAAPTAGNGSELNAISACVIGGASLAGGEGTVLGAILGTILVGIINNALVLLNVSVYWQNLVSGVILIAAVTIDYLTHQKKS
ncbi:ABC transporter permease [Anaerocellum diazotrophicum]|uniref:ABC transporter permease n=1 Tax=Caldicellulosiruptor diazotrophicus TaxID=2806205 RepID=A0ABM7NJW2_9FIRM|nr:ABC transporter permease [Caldicellulosiruptor diazotrophicus]BCS80383.1 ABC transporter permease [Caldicellulosiruptor diazotrophicus]